MYFIETGKTSLQTVCINLLISVVVSTCMKTSFCSNCSNLVEWRMNERRVNSLRKYLKRIFYDLNSVRNRFSNCHDMPFFNHMYFDIVFVFLTL